MTKQQILKNGDLSFGRRGILVAAVVVFGLTWAAGSASAFTEPTEAPPGGSAIAAPINVSATTQTKTGHLILSGTYAGGLVPALSVGDVSPNEKQICWNGVCKNSWQDVVGIGSGYARVWPDATQDPDPTPASWWATHHDDGSLNVQANDQQQWAVAGLASGVRTTSIGVYGVYGVARSNTGGNAYSYGVGGWDAGVSGAGAGIFRGRVLIDRFGVNLTSIGSANALAVYDSTNGGTGIYAEQQGAGGFSGYFSGRLGVYNDDESDPDAFALTVDRNVGIGPGEGFYKTLSFMTNNTEQWNFRVFSKCCTPYLPYLTLNTVAGGTERTVLSFDPNGKLSVGQVVQVGPQFIVNKYTAQGGSDSDATGIYFDSSQGGTVNPTQGAALYVEQASSDPDVYTGYFTGPRTYVGGEFCLNGDCKAAWPGTSGGADLWAKTGSVIHPQSSADTFAIGGSDANAPLFYDPNASMIVLNSGSLQVQAGALTVQPKPAPPPSCFVAGTPVTMADGSEKAIEQIAVGDVVLAFDEHSGNFAPAPVSKIFRHEAQPYLIVNGHLRVTPNHPVLSEGRWVPVGTLGVGDALTGAEGQPVPITTIATSTEDVPVFNLSVATLHTYLANGYVVHNKEGDDEHDLGVEDATPDSDGQLAAVGSVFRRFFEDHVPVAAASTVTGTPDRIIAKGGTITVDYSAVPGGSKLELGNAGRDVASSGDLYLRPNGVAYTVGIHLYDDGSGFAFLGAPHGEFARSKAGNVLSVRNTLGGNATATAGYFKSDSGTATGATLVAENLGSGDAVQGKLLNATNNDSALYGENPSPSGYAGYLSGNLRVFGTAAPAPVGATTTAAQITGGGLTNDIQGTIALEVIAGNPGAAITPAIYGLRIKSPNIAAFGAPSVYGLGVENGTVSGEDVRNTAIYTRPASITTTGGVSGISAISTGVDAAGGAVTGPGTSYTYGIYASPGVGATENYAGYFTGRTAVRGGTLEVGTAASPQQICLNENCISSWPGAGGASKWDRTYYTDQWLLQPITRADNVWLGTATPPANADDTVLSVSENTPAGTSGVYISNNSGNALYGYGGSILTTKGPDLNKTTLSIFGSGNALTTPALLVEHQGSAGGTGETAAEFRGAVNFRWSTGDNEGSTDNATVSLGTTAEPMYLCLNGTTAAECRTTWPSSSALGGTGTAQALVLWGGTYPGASTSLTTSVAYQRENGVVIGSTPAAAPSENDHALLQVSKIGTGTDTFSGYSTFSAYNGSDAVSGATDAVHAVKRNNIGSNMRGSAVYGELYPGSTCQSPGGLCVAMYGSDAVNTSNTFAGYFSGKVKVTSGVFILEDNATDAGPGGPTGEVWQVGPTTAASNGAGLEWRFYEAEGWTTVIWPCHTKPDPGVSDASNGSVMRFKNGGGSCDHYGGLPAGGNTPIPLPAGTYRLVLRVKTNGGNPGTNLDVGVENGTSNIFGTIPAASLNGASWHTVSTVINIPSDVGRKLYLMHEPGGAVTTDVDWVLIRPDY